MARSSQKPGLGSSTSADVRVTAEFTRFSASIDRSAGTDACWPWRGHLHNEGYGLFGRVRAHRMALQLTGVDIPPGMVVRHLCANPPCCNPAHLRIGTQAENLADMVAMGRSLTGERNPSARLTATQVLEIRQRRSLGETLVSLGRAFWISPAMAGLIARGKKWRHLPLAEVRP